MSDIKMDFSKRFEENEKTFQAKMMTIFNKYNHPFDDDLVVNLEDFTYWTPEGQRPWKCETIILENRRSEDVVSKKHISESKTSKESRLTSQSKVKHLSGRTSTKLTQYKKEKNDTTEHKKFVVTQNSDRSVINKTSHVVLPPTPTASKQVDGFTDVNIEKYSLKFLRRCNVAFYQADDDSDNKEASYCEQGNKTLDEVYPDMIRTLSRLWNLNIKTLAADNIVRYYKRQIWLKNKKVFGKKMNYANHSVNKTYTLCPAPNRKQMTTLSAICDSTPLAKPLKISSPGLFSRVHKLGSPSVPVTIAFDSQSNATTSERITDYRAICMDSPFPGQLHMVKKAAIAPAYCTSGTSSPRQMSISSMKAITDKKQMDHNLVQFSYCKDSKRLQQTFHTQSRGNVVPGFPMFQSPEKMSTNHNFCFSGKTRTISRTVATQSLMVGERKHASFKEHPNRTCTLTRSNSFSAFPVAHRANRDFESLYRSLTPSRSQPEFSYQKQLSKTVSSLVYSPGSLRAKRPLAHDLSISISKKPRSITDALIGSSKPLSRSMDSSDLFWSEARSPPTFHHSVVASSLPIHMLSPTPVSLSSLSPAVNGASPKRKNACAYRKLSY